MSALAALAGRLTLPYSRGAEFLPLTLGTDAGGATAIAPYDFHEYRARWGQDPLAPAYVIRLRQDVAGDDLELTLNYSFFGNMTTQLTIPHGTRAGTGFCIPLPADVDATLRFTSLSVSPRLASAGKDTWEIVALLGTIAKLIWLIGAEKATLARVRSDTRDMRFVERAFGAGLDALGRDMRVPRFPPRPYSIDGQTIALWHLDELANGGPVTTVVDQTTLPGAAGHPGSVAGALAGAPGKFGTGFNFPASGGTITVASSANFDIAANADATIEAFVSAVIPADATPRAIVVRRAAETAGGSNTLGWSLCVVNARGFNANILFALCDGVREVRIFADTGIADNMFHHIAGMIDRAHQRARLFVDGVQRATAPIDALGAIAPPDDVRMGSTAAGNLLAGSIDEVRLSRVARTSFHPALGEDDEAYRARLRIFRRWVIPTPANLIAMVNEAAPLGSDPAPYVLIEANQPVQVAECPMRIVPAALAAGTAIALDGTTPLDETAAGTPGDDAGFDPALDLIAYTHANVDSSTDTGGGRMQAGTGKLLDALAARLAAVTPGNLIVEHSYDSAGPTPLHSVGRALRLRHQILGAGVLGALAHRAGFAYVRNLGPDVVVAASAGERLAIRGLGAAGPRVDAGSAFDLTIDPPATLAGTFAWTIITPGTAQAHFAAHSADPPALQTLTASGPTAAGAATLTFAAVPVTLLPGMGISDLTAGPVIPAGTLVVSKTATTVLMSQNATGAGVAVGNTIQFANRSNPPVESRPRVRLVTDAPGDLAVRVEFGRGGRTRSGTLNLRIDPVSLLDGQALDITGNLNPDPNPVIGLLDPGFDPSYLVTHAANPAIDFGADPNNAKMQAASRDALDGLAALLASRATPGRLKVTQAYVPAALGIESVGRQLVLGHETLDPGVLGALASRFFDYVERTGTLAVAAVSPGPWIEIGDAVTTAPVPAEIVLGTPLNLAAVPSALLPGTFNWSTRAIGAGAGTLDTVLRTNINFTPTKPGLFLLTLTYAARDSTRAAPYTFEIRLKPALDIPATIIPKAQYDLIMNVLDSFHPIGVEVRTDNIRKHVPEIEQDPAKAFPAYSFPNFRF
jgi:Concanavalin A-like lectin/glucanases superfamily